MFRKSQRSNDPKPAPRTVTEILDGLNLPEEIREHTDVKRAEVQEKRKPLPLFIQHVFAMAGVLAAGFVTVHLLTEVGKLPMIVGIAAAVTLDAYAIFAADIATRARLRGERGLITRLQVYFGAATSVALNIIFPFNQVLRFAIPAVIILGTMAWVKGVRDKYAAIFIALDLLDKKIRKERREARRQQLAYIAAVGVRSVKADEKKGTEAREGAVAGWRRRTMELGVATREAQHELALTEVAARQQIGTAKVVAQIEAATGDRAQITPRPPVGRPISSPPSQVTGEGPLADFLRGCDNSTDAARRLMTAWWDNHRQNRPGLFGLSFAEVNAAANMARLLNAHNLPITASTISTAKTKLIAEGKFPDAKVTTIHDIVDATVVEPEAITAG